VTKAAQFMGLEIVVDVAEDSVPRCRDIDLGQFLGYSRPRKVRELIERERAAGNLNDSDVCPVAGHPNRDPVFKRTAVEYWLTEQAALFVAARSETKTGADVLKALIDAYSQAKQSARVTRILELCFQDEPRQVKRMFSGLIAELLTMRGEKGHPGNPPWSRSLASDVYRWAFGEDGETGQQSHRRLLNPDPHGASVDYGYCTDEGLQQLQRVIHSGVDQAKLSASWGEWRAKMVHLYDGQPLQLAFAVPARLLRKAAHG